MNRVPTELYSLYFSKVMIASCLEDAPEAGRDESRPYNIWQILVFLMLLFIPLTICLFPGSGCVLI
jgi:hypothetical protein